MKRIRLLLPLALLILSACAPGFGGTVEQDTAFNATVNTEPALYENGAWTYAADTYTLTFDLPAFSDDALFVADARAAPGVDYVNLSVTNTSDAPLSVVWSQSSFVLPDGVTSPAVNGQTSFINAQQGSPTSVIPPSGRLQELAFPANNVFFLGEYQTAPIYNKDQATKSTFRLFLTLEQNGETQTVDVAFVGKAAE